MSCFDERIQAKFADVELEREQMHSYQSEIALPFLRANPFSLLFLGLGLGKSVTSGTLIYDLITEFQTTKVLVIGPLRVMTDTWPSEFAKWRHLATLNYTLIRDNDDDPAVRKASTEQREKMRRALAHSRSSVHFINQEQIEWLVNVHGAKWPYRTVIIDEIGKFKSHSSNRFNALAKVRRTPGLITRLHGLTALPTPEGYEGLFAQLYLADLGQRLGKNITHYRERYFSYNKYSQKWKLRPDAQEEILDKIKDVSLVMESKDYLPMEDATIITKPIHLPKQAMTIYKEMEREFIVTLPNGAEVEAKNAAALSSKLLQIASGVLYETQEVELLDEIKKVNKVHKIHDAKIETLREIVDALDGKPVLVAYHFKSSLDRLIKAFHKAVVMDRDGKCIPEWNKGRIPMMLVHPASAGHGLNLQHGGHNLVFFDLPWSYDNYSQTIGRLQRQGQKNPVLVQVLTALGTDDERVFKALNEKRDVQEYMLRRLKQLIKKFREQKSRDLLETL